MGFHMVLAGVSQPTEGRQLTEIQGHDYRRDDDGSAQVDETRVNSMIAERMRAKMSLDFDTADRLRVTS